MEASLYDEEIMPTTSNSQNSSYNKGNLKLDFTSTNPRRQTSMEGTVLTSPDLNLLALGSPELEKLIVSYGGILTTPTPGQLFKGTVSVTEQQEMYARGFMEALQKLHEQQGSKASQNTTIAAPQNAPSSSLLSTLNMELVSANGLNTATSTIANATPMMCTAGASTISTQSLPLVSLHAAGASQIFPDFQRAATRQIDPSTSLSQILNAEIPSQRLESANIESVEPQVVPGTPPLPPIDLALQETVKNERKKQRNRVAASKCRKRKLEKEADLQGKVEELKDINTKLHSEISDLKKQVSNLKLQVMEHVHGGCEIMLSNQP